MENNTTDSCFGGLADSAYTERIPTSNEPFMTYCSANILSGILLMGVLFSGLANAEEVGPGKTTSAGMQLPANNGSSKSTFTAGMFSDAQIDDMLYETLRETLGHANISAIRVQRDDNGYNFSVLGMSGTRGRYPQDSAFYYLSVQRQTTVKGYCSIASCNLLLPYIAVLKVGSAGLSFAATRSPDYYVNNQFLNEQNYMYKAAVEIARRAIRIYSQTR